MADNVAITAGSGTTIAADDIGAGLLVQRVKPMHGADGSGTDVSAASPMPVIAGVSTVVSRSHIIADSDGAQSDAALITCTSPTQIVVTQLSAKADASNTGNVSVRIGFGAAAVPAGSLSGTDAILLHGKFSAGQGQQVGNGAGIIAIGAAGHDLRVTSDDPAGGNIYITYSYYTI